MFFLLRLLVFLLFQLLLFSNSAQTVWLGVDVFFQNHHEKELKDKRVGLVINHTSYTSSLEESYDLFRQHAQEFKIVALFSPEHGLRGNSYAGEHVEDKHQDSIPVYSLHGKTRRPTEEMLKNIDVLIFDIQEIGSRSYTYSTTLYYIMEEAAKRKIQVIVLDRPNPMGGVIVEGPMLKQEWRSFLGYVNVPYCHGMTIGELAQFFNGEYQISCELKVIPMKGWKRWMNFSHTRLSWVPTSPNIPEWDTPFFYASTGILGELGIVNTGIGYTQPFKIVGAPWIKAEELSKAMNKQKLPGVKFIPYYFRPFYGAYEKEECQGIKIIITDYTLYKPLSVQYLLIGVLKSLYPKKVISFLESLSNAKRRTFCIVNGNNEILDMIANEKYVAWKMIKFDEDERADFLKKRLEYLIY